MQIIHNQKEPDAVRKEYVDYQSPKMSDADEIVKSMYWQQIRSSTGYIYGYWFGTDLLEEADTIIKVLHNLPYGKCSVWYICRHNDWMSACDSCRVVIKQEIEKEWEYQETQAGRRRVQEQAISAGLIER